MKNKKIKKQLNKKIDLKIKYVILIILAGFVITATMFYQMGSNEKENQINQEKQKEITQQETNLLMQESLNTVWEETAKTGLIIIKQNFKMILIILGIILFMRSFKW